MRTNRIRVLVPLVLGLVTLPSMVLAQQTASIRGIVQDASGAVVGGASVQAMNLDTGQALQTVTTLSGLYVLGNVPVGNYRVEATLDGFKRFVRDSVSVNTATATDVNIILEIGEVTESVTIEGTAAPLLRTDNAELSTVMERKLMIDLPLGLSGKSTGAGASGRREIGQFTFLTPGVSGGRGWNRHILGAPQFTGQDIIDGVPFTLLESPGLTDRMGPPFESVQEFKVSTTMYPANLGRGVGITNYTLRSGTNQFHGNAFWFIRNDKLDASGFFNPSRPIVRQNEYGGNIGGPIRKNKSFFHFSWQGFKRRGGTGALGLLTIPTNEFRQGDFAALTDPGGNLIPVFDGNSTRPDGEGGFMRDAFQNNRVPATRIDPIAGTVMGMLPAPDRAGIVDNWVNRSSNPTDDDSFALKFDHALSDNHRLSGSWWYANLRIFRYSAWGNHPLDTGIRTPTQTWSLRVNYDWVITPTLLNHLSWGYSNFRIPRTGNVLHDGNILDVPGLPDEIVVLPSFRPAGYLAMGNSGAGPEFRINPTTIVSDTLTWTRGKHQIMFGGEVWLQNNTRRVNAWEAGRFDFRTTSSSQPNSPNFSRWGDGLASMLQGDVFQGFRLVGPITGLYEGDYFAWYVEDKIQITPKFTASLGLRYEIARPVREAGNIMSAMDLRLANPAAGGIPGAYVFGNDPIVPATDMTNWGPRVGLAYSVNDKTVIRTGIGIIYTQSNFVNSGVVVGQPELKLGYVAFDSPQSLDNGISPAFKLRDGFPPFTGQLPNLDPGIGVGSTAEWVNPDGARPPYTVNWNFNIQRELIAGIVADVAYVGVRGTGWPSNLLNLNQVPTSHLSLGGLLRRPFNDPEAAAAGISAPYPGFSGSVAQALRPFPQYNRVAVKAHPVGNSTYHSMQAKIEKRFSKGLGFLTTYTMSKNISDINANAWSIQDPNPMDAERGYLEKSISPIDRTHTLVANWIYELPFGKNATGGAGAALRGWEVGSTIYYESGPPLRIVGGPPLPIFNGGNRPSRVPGVSRRTGVSKANIDPARDLFLNIDAFAQPAAFTFGDVGRVEPDMRGFSFYGTDLSISKRTYITAISEAFNIEFRAQFFNVFNQVVFQNIATNINSPQSFGRVRGQANQPRNVTLVLKINF